MNAAAPNALPRRGRGWPAGCRLRATPASCRPGWTSAERLPATTACDGPSGGFAKLQVLAGWRIGCLLHLCCGSPGRAPFVAATVQIVPSTCMTALRRLCGWRSAYNKHSNKLQLVKKGRCRFVAKCSAGSSSDGNSLENNGQRAKTHRPSCGLCLPAHAVRDPWTVQVKGTCRQAAAAAAAVS